ncbi:hypothetical protein P7C71_g2584, partial [Lecanoromycetidae sp. Uapishka_2]
MAQQQQHAPGGYYSGKNKIPDIKTFVQNLDKDKKNRDAKLEELRKLERQAGGPGTSDAQPHQETKAGKPGTMKTVHDPTTGNEVQIEDVDKDFMKAVEDPKLSVPNANLGKSTTVKTDASQSNPEYKHNQDVTAPPDPVAEGSTSDVPIHGEKTNILFHPTPSVSYEPMFAALETRASGLCIGVFIAIVLLGKMFGGSLKGLIPTAMCIVSGIFLWMKEVVRSGREVEWSSEQSRGETATANLLPESVEWMNTLLGIVWGLINPDMFASVADTLEDVMGASVPGVIENVRVAEINQGNNPIRILSLRSLPDTHVKELKESIHLENKKTKDPQEAAADEEGGDYYNIEASFAYHAKPSSAKDPSSKARNMHMQLVFYLGIKGLFGVPLPIFVELQGLVGTIRLRLQMTPEPPYLKNLTFTLMGLPQVQAGCIPMVEKGVNILNLPLISNFVNYAIGAAASMYVAPKSMSIDLGAILQGDEIAKDTLALGVMWIRIHRAIGLSKQDKRGSKGGGSDPYITLTFSKYGKPMYCTRVITDDLNPIWEETAALLVMPEYIKADEQLSVELWDSDRSSADDIVGKVELSMQKMIQHPGKMYPQVSKLSGMEADSEMPGELHWEVGYFTKPKFRPALRTDGKNPDLPESLKDNPELQDDKGVLNNADQDAVAHTPPDPLWPSGICSVVVHQIVNLELENIQGSEGNRKGREYEPAMEAGENTDEVSKKLPSSYCTILFNDQLSGKRGAAAYAVIWLHHLVDNTENNVNIPIWTTKNGARLTQNYITEENVRAKETPGLEDLNEIGRLQFRCQFKAGTDEDHERFVVDNDTRETFETWEACLAEGVRAQRVTKDMPPAVQELHDKSLTDTRDVLKQADPEERQKWLAKDGQDWSGAFTHDPKAYMDSKGRKRAEPGADAPVHNPHVPSDDDDNIDEDDSDSASDLGVNDGGSKFSGKQSNGTAESAAEGTTIREDEGKREEVNKRTEKRHNRGLLQWKPVRNLAFAKDEAKFSVKKMKNKLTGSLGGREPDVETET